MTDPETVTLPTEAIIEAAATFYAYGNIVAILSGRVDTALSREPWGPAGDLLVAAGLPTSEGDRDSFSVIVVKEQIDRREAEITAALLKRIADAAQLQVGTELGLAQRV